MLCFKNIVFLFLLALPEPIPAWKSDVVKEWARNLGEELWRLNEGLTQADQIRVKYKQMNASVKQKNGQQILESSLRSVSAMLTKKIKAVKCIHATAEKLAEEFDYITVNESDYTEPFEYCSAKYSNFTFPDNNSLPLKDIPKFVLNDLDANISNYADVNLERDSHFYDISVNTNISCVHVPTNIYHKEQEPLNAILWSKGLNDVFINNYKSDPSLSWQYFGSSHGILRFYPGMPWKRKKVDIYDCRERAWYIEAATCSKDVIILFDVSGSMTGFKNFVARTTLKALLETLSNNDYVNVFAFKNETYKVVSCFDKLVQATPENIETFIKTLKPKDKDEDKEKVKPTLKLEGNANLTQAYIKAFNTLKEKRQKAKCKTSETQGCNQLVMVITDYVPGNLSEVFEEHNREIRDNKTYIPVRVFTYLIGKEVTNVQEIQSMACTNRGYFVHIHSVEEVQQQVLKYINVIARPMILEGGKGKPPPPPTWTHAKLDETRTRTWEVSLEDELNKPDEDKLVTSVGIPAFDYKHNELYNDAILLGVAGTDVPIDSIGKLAQPHQLGVNGYSFIVSNNGYVLLHPLLIATINGDLQENSNSIDIVEVEQVNDGRGPRELGVEILDLRRQLVDGKNGQRLNIPVLYHFDNMRRIAEVRHNYFFNKLNDTPFSMGISLPKHYGDTELLLKNNPLEAKEGKNLIGINVTDYFRYNFRIHPDWVYCKYHYLEGHEAATAELELWSFLVRLSENDLNITTKQYNDEDKVEDEGNFDLNKHCNATGLGQDDYYCTEDLVKQLVFEAKLTAPYFNRTWNPTEDIQELAKKYNVSVRFIATSSGLTRWHYLFDDDKNEIVDDNGNRHRKFNGSVFGDVYNKAIEENWYKSAVLQHLITKESLVIATPLPVLDKSIVERPPVWKDDEVIMTASYAIFYKDGKSETPASVVGFQLPYTQFLKSFLELVKSVPGDMEDFNCTDNSHECYVVDSSGYVVLTTGDQTNIGSFFGKVNDHTGKVMVRLMDLGVFKKVEVFNYQALCLASDLLPEASSAWSLRTPFDLVATFMQWLFTELVLVIFNWNKYAYAFEDEYSDELIDIQETTTTAMPVLEENKTITPQDEEPKFSCDHSITLYILNQSYFKEDIGSSLPVYEDVESDCYPAFWAAHVLKTNLLLIVVAETDNPFIGCRNITYTDPVPTLESREKLEPCHKLDLGGLHRRPLEGCFTYNEKERNITECGFGNMARANLQFIMWSSIIVTLVSRFLPM